MLEIMDRAARFELYRKAFYRFGTKDRLLKTAEEMAEFMAALMRHLNLPAGHDPQEVLDSVLEELADTSIMVEQSRAAFMNMRNSRGESVEDIRQRKLARLAVLVEADLKDKNAEARR